MGEADKLIIVIAGAGPAGLTAAYEALSSGAGSPVVFEASPMIGGISRTADRHGNRMDMGGHRFFTKSERVRTLWHKLLPYHGRPGSPETRMLVRDRVSRIYFIRKFFDYPLSPGLALLRGLGLARTLRIGAGYIASRVRRLPETSLENFYINRFGRPLYEMFFENYTEKVWGVHPSRLGAEWGAQRVKGLSVTAVLRDAAMRALHLHDKKKETSLIDRFDYPRLGPGQMWETMADEIRDAGGEIEMCTRVSEIHVTDGRVTSVTVRDGQGVEREVKCDAFFSSMPVDELIAAIRGAEVPAEVRDVAKALPFRDFLTVGVLVDRLEVTAPDGSLIPDNWIYIQEKGLKMGRLQIFNNWSPDMVRDPENSVWIGVEYFCNEGDEILSKSDEEMAAFAVRELEEIGFIKASGVRDTVVEHVDKAYPAYHGSYSGFETVREWLSGIGNLYCIGRNGQHRYNNMDHSMLTAMTAVDALRGLAPRDAVWRVNTESAYHEDSAE